MRAWRSAAAWSMAPGQSALMCSREGKQPQQVRQPQMQCLRDEQHQQQHRHGEGTGKSKMVCFTGAKPMRDLNHRGGAACTEAPGSLAGGKE